ncbi:hypothetical protein TVAG_021790 [Trichomonas vaginalis G3]|uniref:Uncharacterized protein n=1 Tax=Trichomonas vaginalis (strain ATCC PRA-98 / G3) TaxID=412133 RepID=A2DHF9_TRIV3|nr:hypothetical protein TVAGG3_0678540 [Trichomonas vaginalis G3]EAY20232.1 hypothetical protein TVAG_021790 [Trichomonas vaginalis G3]KAI5507727.1 hypothetical protein TVAGG3_0678540 [Trichomonas vaginalis G3]|eukprot:XP_001581218.1 hypothetical protein [Trichomonas vaginalis G3]
MTTPDRSPSSFEQGRRLVKEISKIPVNPDIGNDMKTLLSKKFLDPIKQLEDIVNETMSKELWEETVKNISFTPLQKLGWQIIQKKNEGKQQFEEIISELEKTNQLVCAIQSELDQTKTQLANGAVDFESLSTDRLNEIHNKIDDILRNRTPSDNHNQSNITNNNLNINEEKLQELIRSTSNEILSTEIHKQLEDLMNSVNDKISQNGEEK